MSANIPLPAPGLRLLRERDGMTWSVLIIDVEQCFRPVIHGDTYGPRETVLIVLALNEGGRTFGTSDLKYWPGRWTVRVMDQAEPVISARGGHLHGATVAEALQAAIDRYRSPEWSAECELLRRLKSLDPTSPLG